VVDCVVAVGVAICRARLGLGQQPADLAVGGCRRVTCPQPSEDLLTFTSFLL
jgi:hypothetical protein